LLQRGTCPFVQKIQAAKDAGAAAVLIFNDGGEGREEPFQISGVPYAGIPVAMTSAAVGAELYAAAGQTLRIAVDATTTPRAQYNVIADSYEGKRNRTIVIGGHLDSVEEGPGINDNGSGVSAMLEIAEQIAELPRAPRNRLRFAFWGAEESGLIGSTAYVRDQLENGRLSQIEANLNFDMLASPNFARFVYDGDNSTGEGSVGPPGSAEIEQLFLRYFEDQGLATDPTAFDGRSDYGEFIANGVPAGGLFSGAEGIKTLEQEARYGGFAGMPYDECYHLACDSFFNLNWTSLDQMSDAVAHATWTLARSRSPLVGASTAAARAKNAKKAKQARRSAKRMAYKAHFPVR
ncbi:MAG TPA: M20/M25/M40 family metallo-hydrolase, partial [Thermoleophilaceae bacterium]|nr:M20/M25/M40 family metallo-hydrolase [Thermoleophilaceae bacterium]